MADEQEDDDKVEDKQRIAAAYGRAAATFDRVGPRYFGYFGQRLVERARVGAGQHVLDVACGRGAALLPASEAVGRWGRVVGVDLSDGMIAALAADVRELHRTNVEVYVMDAERLEFPEGSFDRVLCAFALFFFPRLEHALAEMRRVLRPGGRIAVSTWDKADDAGWDWFDDLVQSYLPAEAREREEPGPVLDEPQRVEATLAAAGFRDVTASRETFETIYSDEDEWWRSLWSHGGRMNLEKIEAAGGPDALARFKADVFDGLQKIMQPDGIHRVKTAICAVGRK